MKYDHEDRGHREILAATMVAMLDNAGFTEEPPKDRGFYTRKERMFSRPVGGGIRVCVYTTVVGDEVRRVGTDAIRVCAVYTASDGRDRGIARAEKRVNRTGEIVAITDRTLERMREVWGLIKTKGGIERCHCGAPKFRSKKGNHVCAELCWKHRERSRWAS